MQRSLLPAAALAAAALLPLLPLLLRYVHKRAVLLLLDQHPAVRHSQLALLWLPTQQQQQQQQRRQHWQLSASTPPLLPRSSCTGSSSSWPALLPL
jgi:hypothetical protein